MMSTLNDQKTSVVKEKHDVASMGTNEGIISDTKAPGTGNSVTDDTITKNGPLQQDAIMVDLTTGDSSSAKHHIDLTNKDTSPSSSSNTTTSEDVNDQPDDIVNSSAAQPHPQNAATQPPISSLSVSKIARTSENVTTSALPVMGTLPATVVSHPFTYIRTDQKVYVDGNEKYKAAYGEDLFVFRHE